MVRQKVKKSKSKSKSKSKKEIKIQNIVATTSLEQDVPLIKLAETLPNTEYNPE